MGVENIFVLYSYVSKHFPNNNDHNENKIVYQEFAIITDCKTINSAMLTAKFTLLEARNSSVKGLGLCLWFLNLNLSLHS